MFSGTCIAVALSGVKSIVDAHNSLWGSTMSKEDAKIKQKPSDTINRDALKAFLKIKPSAVDGQKKAAAKQRKKKKPTQP